MTPTSILIADDNQPFLSSAEEILRRLGFRCDTVLDGGEALSRLRSRSWDVAVLDVNLSGVSGLDVIERCRELCPGTLFVAISGLIQEHVAESCRIIGADVVLEKPFTISELLDVIARHRPTITAAE